MTRAHHAYTQQLDEERIDFAVFFFFFFQNILTNAGAENSCAHVTRSFIVFPSKRFEMRETFAPAFVPLFFNFFPPRTRLIRDLLLVYAASGRYMIAYDQVYARTWLARR